MSRLLSVLILIALSTMAGAQPAPVNTIILVRHAEKADDGSANPPLTLEGQVRADRLADMLEHIPVDIIFSTSFLRTQQTAEPLAKRLNVPIRPYDYKEPIPFLQSLFSQFPGKAILISGHSNTTPQYANLLIGEEKFSQFPEDEYSTILIITTTEYGKGKAIEIHY